MNPFSSLPENPGELIDRLWQKDATLWKSAFANGDDPGNWMGWLNAVEWMREHVDSLSAWAEDVCKSGRYDHVILLGMGGSSLAAEVFSGVFPNRAGYLQLTVVDTTSPAQIKALDLNLERALFVVSSKSGTTLETMDLFARFYQIAGSKDKHPGDRFIAITDAGSPLAHEASMSGFCRVFLNPADIGGRYCALSFFGLVPAALIGVDLNLLLENLRQFCDQVKSGDDTTVTELAYLLGSSALAGRNQMQLEIAKPIQVLAVWIEQLIAESTGKNGAGLIPVYGQTVTERNRKPSSRGFTINIGFGGGSDNQIVPDADLNWSLKSPYDIASEFFRWQVATALASVMMNVNPFDQPDVEQAKSETRTFITRKRSVEFRVLLENDFCVFYASDVIVGGSRCSWLADVFDRFQSRISAAEYLGMLAWLPVFAPVEKTLQKIRAQLSRRFDLPTTLGYGPRYLHSTGQLHKGGPASGCFIQITDSGLESLPVPGRQYGFDDLHRAQADGDYSVLENKARPIMRIELKSDRLGALDRLRQGLVEISELNSEI